MSKESSEFLKSLLKTFLITLFKLIILGFAYCCRLAGMILTRTGESIEKMLVR